MAYVIGLLVLILPTDVSANLSNEQVKLAYIAHQEAIRNEISPNLFLSLMACESKISKMALGDYQSESDTLLSRGIFQFQKATFYGFAKQYGLNNLEWMNPYDQITLASRMISEGGIYHWKNCGIKSGLLK